MPEILSMTQDDAKILEDNGTTYRFPFGQGEFYDLFDAEGFCKNGERLEKLVLASWEQYKEQNFYDELRIL